MSNQIEDDKKSASRPKKVPSRMASWERESDMVKRNATIPFDSPEFRLAVSKYPQCEVERNREIFRRAQRDGPGPSEEADVNLVDKEALVRIRWENPICQYCRYKPRWPIRYPDVHLKKCSACHLVWYCGKACQRADWKKGHKEWCENLPNVTEVDPSCPYKLAVFTSEKVEKAPGGEEYTQPASFYCPESDTWEPTRGRVRLQMTNKTPP